MPNDGQTTRILLIATASAFLLCACAPTNTESLGSAPESTGSPIRGSSVPSGFPSLQWIAAGKGVDTGVAAMIPAAAGRMTFGAIDLCTRATVKLLGASLVDSSGLHVVDSGARVVDVGATGMIGSDPALASSLGFHSFPLEVTAPCGGPTGGPDTPRQVEVAVTVGLTDPQRHGQAKAVDVTYDDGGRVASARVNVEIRLCPQTDKSSCAV